MKARTCFIKGMEYFLLWGLLVVSIVRIDANCGTPTTISNGYRSYSSTSYTSYAYYYCNTGYYGTGDNSIQCIYSSWSYRWETLSYYCTIRNCGTAPSVSSASKSTTTTNYGGYTYYTCNTGYTASGTNYISCQSNGAWSTVYYSCTIKNCGTPQSISYGSKSTTTTNYGGVTTYSCNTGYYGTGTNTISCTSSGSWSTLSYYCTIRNCGTAPSLSHSTKSTTTTNYGGTTTYTCVTGYYGSGTRTISCQSSGSWSNLGYTCIIKDCGSPSGVSNGYYSAPTTTYTSTATYYCNTGYYSSGTNTITCQSSGSWSSLSFSCHIKDCGTPPGVSNGQVSASTTTYLSTATYSCNTGYLGTSNPSRTCASSGSWASSTFSCYYAQDKAVSQTGNTYLKASTYGVTGFDRTEIVFDLQGLDAHVAISPSDGATTNMYVFIFLWYYQSQTHFRLTQSGSNLVTYTESGVTVDYTMKKRFYISWDSSTIRTGRIKNNVRTEFISYSHSSYSRNYILFAGYASNSATITYLVDCGTPPSVSHASVSAPITTYTATATYSCNTGYWNSGTATITCQQSAEWVTPSYTCTIMDCYTPPTISNAQISSNTTTYGTYRTYSCNHGYRANSGQATINCGASATWSSTSFACVLINCGTPPAVSHASVSAPTTLYQDTATYSCNLGYKYISGSSTIQCGFNDNWSTPTYTCQLIDCYTPPSVTNGALSSGATTYDTTRTYSCNIGYYSIGTPSTITCLVTEAWSATTFACQIYDCYDPSTTSNGVRSYTTTTYLSTATYSCNKGYYSQGTPATITCGPVGNWESTTFQCIIYDCGNPNTTDNGQVSYTLTTYQATATYSCDIGYYVIGEPDTIDCMDKGIWNDTTFRCQIVDCFAPPQPENGQVTNGTTTYLSTQTLSCDIGYLEEGGTNIITCEASGNWSYTDFWCKIIGKSCNPPIYKLMERDTNLNLSYDCHEPDPILHATVTNGSTTFWKNLTYSCDYGYVDTGLENITCLLTGFWSVTDFNCPPYDCEEPDDVLNGDKLAPITTFNHTTEYTCHLGHYPSNNDTSLLCLPGGWTNISFWCVPVDCEDPVIDVKRGEKYWDTTIFRTINSSEVEYICDIGFTLDPEDSDGIIECNYTGIWEEIEFSCIFNYCKNISISYKSPTLYPKISDGLDKQMYLLNDTLYYVDCCGVVAGWEFKPVQTGFVYMMIWRKNDQGVPVMVGYNTILVADTAQVLNVTITDEKIAVKAFDMIGWFSYSGSMISYEECDPTKDTLCPQSTLHLDGPKILKNYITANWDNDATVLANRSYAIKYYFTRNTPMEFLQSEYNVSIADHLERNASVMTFSTAGVDHAEAATYTFEPMGNTPLKQYFYVDPYFGTVKIFDTLPKSNETSEFVYNVTAVDGCENYAYTILTITTYNAPPRFNNLPSRLELREDTQDGKNIFDIEVYDPSGDNMCCSLASTYPTTTNFLMMLNGTHSPFIETSKNSYFRSVVVDSYYVRICCQDSNDSTFGTLLVKVKGEREIESVDFPDWFFMSLAVSCAPILLLLISSCGLLLYLSFCL